MRSFDLSPYRRSTVGFDRLFDYLENGRAGDGDNYPPYDIEKLGDDRYRITLAVAGFAPGDIDITARQNMLVVTGRKSESRARDGNYLHVGIATRAFERRFELADFVRAEAADMKDGLLSIELVREIPEAMKPRKIDIRSGEGRSIENAPSHEPETIEAREREAERENERETA